MADFGDQPDIKSKPVTSVVKTEPTVSTAVRRWLDQIEQSRKREKDWRKEGRRILEIYEGAKKDQTPFNILYSNTETLAPAIYGQVPRPRVTRRFKDEDPMGKAASEASQRVLSFLMNTNSEEYDDFDTSMKDTVLDSCLPGRGVIEFCYTAEMAPPAVEGEPETVTDECVYSNAVEWNGCYIGYAKKWRDVPWIAFEMYLTRAECTKQFGKAVADKINYVPETTGDTEDDTGHRTHDEEDNTDRLVALVYKIWDKRAKKLCFVSQNYPTDYLKQEDDPYQITGFFPVPRPLQLIHKTHKLVPTALYLLYENQAKELNLVSTRINRLIAACKVRGIYDAALDEIEELLKKDDNTLIAAGQASTLHRGEGLEKYIWMMPIDKIIAVIQQLYLARQQIKQVIYEITGISDIMRGSSRASETLGAQEIKEQWGTLRLKSMQKAVQRFARESLRIMLEMAINRFSPDTWAKMTQLPYLTPQQEQQMKMMQQAVQQAQMQGQQVPPADMQRLQQMGQTPTWTAVLGLLKDRLAREYHIDIETNSTIDPDASEDKQNIAELMNAISQFMNGVAPLIQAGSLPIDAAKAILLGVVRRYEFGSEIEDYIKNMQQPQPQQDPAAGVKLEITKAEAQAKMEEIAQTRESKKAEHEMRMQEMAGKAEFAKLMSRIKISEAQSKAAASERALQAKTQATAAQTTIKTQGVQQQAAAKAAASPPAVGAGGADNSADTNKRKLIVIRHGTTDMNDQNKLRGWSDTPLNAGGVREAEQMAKQLKGKQIGGLYSSDFQRAAATAQIISRADSVPIKEVTPGLRPWNVGQYTGMDSAKAADILLLHATQKPDEPVAGGESFNQFKQRCLGTVLEILAKDQSPVIGLVAHHRNERLISAWVAAGALPDGSIDVKTFTDWNAGCEPGCFEELKVPVQQAVLPQGAPNATV